MTRLQFDDRTEAGEAPGRYVACLETPARAGQPVLTEAARARLAKLSLEIEGDPQGTGETSPLEAINHGPQLIWIRAIAKLPAMPDPDAARARLAKLGLEIEGDLEGTGETSPLEAIKHGPQLIWIRAVGKLPAMPDADAVEAALARRLAWLAPVFELPGVQSPTPCSAPDPTRCCFAAPAPSRRSTGSGSSARSCRQRWRKRWPRQPPTPPAPGSPDAGIMAPR